MRIFALSVTLLGILATVATAAPGVRTATDDRAAKDAAAANAADEQFTAAVKLMEERKFAEAIKAFTEAIDLNPENPAAYDGRGLALVKLGKRVEAAQDFDKAIEVDPNYFFAYRHRATNLKALAKIKDKESRDTVDDAVFDYRRDNPSKKVTRRGAVDRMAQADYDKAASMEKKNLRDASRDSNESDRSTAKSGIHRSNARRGLRSSKPGHDYEYYDGYRLEGRHLGTHDYKGLGGAGCGCKSGSGKGAGSGMGGGKGAGEAQAKAESKKGAGEGKGQGKGEGKGKGAGKGEGKGAGEGKGKGAGEGKGEGKGKG